MLLGARQFFEKRGAPLPYDAEVQYLESAGASASIWIDTGIVPTIDTSADVGISENSRGNWCCILGSATSDNNADTWLLRVGANDTRALCFRIGGKSKDNAIPISLGQYVDVSCSKTALVANGTSVAMGATDYSVTPTLRMYLFQCNLNGVRWQGRGFIGRIYYCKIYEANVLVRDFIPVRFTNEQGVSEGAMYDRLGVGGMNPDGSPRTDGLYRNRGTGAFTIGPDK